jgi:SAM-dependent methyltransferase
MPFSAQTSGASWCKNRPSRAEDDADFLLGALRRHADAMLEIGPGSGARAAWLLRRLPATDYLAFEPSPRLLAAARHAVSVFAERAAVEGRDLALALPVADASRGVVLCLDLLEFLRMDQLYMVFNEARRTLKPGGLCVFRTLSFAPGPRGRLAASLRDLALRIWPALVGGARPLDLHHYLSPEDWRILEEHRAPGTWFTRQTLLLERL